MDLNDKYIMGIKQTGKQNWLKDKDTKESIQVTQMDIFSPKPENSR